jgi:hypothetical protein
MLLPCLTLTSVYYNYSFDLVVVKLPLSYDVCVSWRISMSLEEIISRTVILRIRLFPLQQRLHIIIIIIIIIAINNNVSRNNRAGVLKGYGMEVWGSIPGRFKRFLFSPQRRNRLWGPPRLLTNGHWQLFIIIYIIIKLYALSHNLQK